MKTVKQSKLLKILGVVKLSSIGSYLRQSANSLYPPLRETGSDSGVKLFDGQVKTCVLEPVALKMVDQRCWMTLFSPRYGI